MEDIHNRNASDLLDIEDEESSPISTTTPINNGNNAAEPRGESNAFVDGQTNNLVKISSIVKFFKLSISIDFNHL